METIKVQAQIRQNAEEVSSYLSDMTKWQEDIGKKDAEIRRKRSSGPKALPVRSGSGTVKVVEKEVPTSSSSSSSSQPSSTTAADTTALTPATLATHASAPSLAAVEPALKAKIPAARGVASTKDAETAERERGNMEYEMGNFAAAAKAYTKCLGLKARNYVAFSNRAMAYIKLKEYLRAETDCTAALAIEPGHVKSLTRRATARNAIGRHRAALQDLLKAAELEPGNKQVRVEMQRAKEMLRSAVNRAPLVAVRTTWHEAVAAADGEAVAVQGPDLPYPGEPAMHVSADAEDAGVRVEIVEEPATVTPPSSSSGAAATDATAPPAPQPQSSSRASEPAATAPPAPPKPSTTAAAAAAAAATAAAPARARKDPKDSQSQSQPKPKPKTAVLRGYELERELKRCVGDDAALDRLFTTLKPTHAGKMFDGLLEADVVVDFLLAAGRYHSRGHGPADALVAWFEAIAGAGSFRMVKALVAAEQREKLKGALAGAAGAGADRARVDGALALWGLSE